MKNPGLGIIAGIATGVFWGIPFLVPQMLPGFSSLEIAFGRFFFFGLISLLFIKPVLQIVRSLSLRDRFLLLLLSASGFWFYSILLFWGVQHTDGVLASLVIGLLPITIPLFTPGRTSGGWRFYAGLLLLLAGLVNLFVYPIVNADKVMKLPSVAGVVALFCCLALWTTFAILNSRFLQRNPQIPRKDFASVIGVVSLICIAPIFFLKVDLHQLVARDHAELYLISAVALGVGSSWIANWLWNICSFHCRPEVAGPLIVSETIFGLIYSFGFEHRFPHSFEMGSIVLFLVGVALVVTAPVRLDPKINA
jgi:drug/metabolite transporter (DMT)-like permease